MRKSKKYSLEFGKKEKIFREKSVVNEGLAKFFPNVRFEEGPPELDHAGDVDYIGYIADTGKAIGIQINPITVKANFGNYSPSERMRQSFNAFKSDFGGAIFILYSLDGEIANREIISEIRREIDSLITSQSG